jgi:hypothetical protein
MTEEDFRKKLKNLQGKGNIFNQSNGWVNL